MLVLDLCWLLTCLKYGHLKLAYTHICVSWEYVFLILAVAVRACEEDKKEMHGVYLW